ncbi:MAG: oxidoreductase [Thermoleophilia bacterium]|nr:oxidoreductase [Thermoleophilia bacterium]
MPDDAGVIRVGLIGYGLAGAVFHAPLIEAVAGLSLRLIVTGDTVRATAARDRHVGATIVSSPDALFARADELDLVVIAAPNRVHGELTRASFAAGLDVVVDKPMCPTAAEARELVELAGEQGRMLTVFQNRRWDSDALTLQSLIDAGSLGKIHRFESRFERWRPVVGSGWREQGDPAEGGGILLDLGPHLIDQALHMFGRADVEHAEVGVVRPGAQADDDVFIALHHTDSGVRSHLWMSAVSAQPGPRMRVLGGRAAWVSREIDPQEASLRSGADPRAAGWGSVPRTEWGVLGAAPGDPSAGHPHAPVRGNYVAFYEGVMRSLRTGAEPPVDPLDAVRVLELIEIARAGLFARDRAR